MIHTETDRQTDSGTDREVCQRRKPTRNKSQTQISAVQSATTGKRNNRTFQFMRIVTA